MFYENSDNANENCSILLTSNSTFKLKRNEYSNSVYLCERKASSNFELLSAYYIIDFFKNFGNIRSKSISLNLTKNKPEQK